MQVSLTSENPHNIFGCFFDANDSKVYWYHVESQSSGISNTAAFSNYQISDGKKPKYVVEYPLLCYLDALPDKR